MNLRHCCDLGVELTDNNNSLGLTHDCYLEKLSLKTTTAGSEEDVEGRITWDCFQEVGNKLAPAHSRRVHDNMTFWRWIGVETSSLFHPEIYYRM